MLIIGLNSIYASISFILSICCLESVSSLLPFLFMITCYYLFWQIVLHLNVKVKLFSELFDSWEVKVPIQM